MDEEAESVAGRILEIEAYVATVRMRCSQDFSGISESTHSTSTAQCRQALRNLTDSAPGLMLEREG